jgi:hypothetical protein
MQVNAVDQGIAPPAGEFLAREADKFIWLRSLRFCVTISLFISMFTEITLDGYRSIR